MIFNKCKVRVELTAPLCGTRATRSPDLLSQVVGRQRTETGRVEAADFSLGDLAELEPRVEIALDRDAKGVYVPGRRFKQALVDLLADRAAKGKSKKALHDVRRYVFVRPRRLAVESVVNVDRVLFGSPTLYACYEAVPSGTRFDLEFLVFKDSGVTAGTLSKLVDDAGEAGVSRWVGKGFRETFKVLSFEEAGTTRSVSAVGAK